MNAGPIVSIVLAAHVPFMRHPERPGAPEERRFFEAVSETLLPLLEVLDRLERDRVPFRLGVSLSPTLCHLLSDDYLRERYQDYTARQLELGARLQDEEAGRRGRERVVRLAAFRGRLAERHGPSLLSVFDHYRASGRVEILATAATHAFLPFFANRAEALQAQFEAAAGAYRDLFDGRPQGFWLPELGWTPGLDRWLRAYNFAYTIVDTHGLLRGRPAPDRGVFYPVRTRRGVFILGRDFHARRDIEEMRADPVYCDARRDLGFELDRVALEPFLDTGRGRTTTGYKRWSQGGSHYNPAAARERAREHARIFLDRRAARLAEAAALMDRPPLSLCAYDADDFGRSWYEGPAFLEALFREGAGTVQFMTPAEYLFKQNAAEFQTVAPAYSSWAPDGYGGPWLDASNDWIYRHLIRGIERMTEVAERFPDRAGLRERILNQAARELLLSLDSAWPAMLSHRAHAIYARAQLEEFLRDFTTLYEALASSYISTEWLMDLERRHNIFPGINYRVFRRKR